MSGTITIAVAANDDREAPGTLTVEVNIGSAGWQTASYNGASGFYESSWDTTSAGGSVSIAARATDGASQTGNATAISVTVDNSGPDEITATFADSSYAQGRKKWRAQVTVTVELADGSGTVAPGATVTATWSGGASGTYYGTTNSSGQLTFTSSNINNTVGSATLTIDSITGSAISYSSTGQSVTVDKP